MPKTLKNEEMLEEFVPAISLLLRRLRSNTPPENRDFSHTQKSVLSRIYRDGPATSAELARAEGIKPQSMGTAIQTLEELKLVAKEAHPTDGRQMIVKLTAKGSAMVKASRDARNDWLDDAIEKLSKPEQEILRKASVVLRKLAES